MPRLVRRASLFERFRDYLDPHDFLFWLSETWNDDAYDDWLNQWATVIGVALNIVFVLARGASKQSASLGNDDVFGERSSGKWSGWFAWFAAYLAHFLTVLCFTNALNNFYRTRHYRLFEQPVDAVPATPSAHRVRVDSSQNSSPLRYLQKLVSSDSASQRAYPDAEREVWQLSVWDPKPAQLTIFTLFSPGHVVLYYLLLPPAALDPSPSVTVVKTILFGTLLSLQLRFLKNAFIQQAKDISLVHGEVINEYDTKFVRPSLNRPVRDVAIQTRESAMTPRGTKTREVDIYTPTTIVNRGFRTNPNRNYARQYDPDNLSSEPDFTRRRSSGGGLPRSTITPAFTTPMNNFSQTDAHAQTSISRPGTSGAEFSSPLKPHHERLRERSPMKGDGGSMGIYSHANSPLRKATSSKHLRPNGESQRQEGLGASPLKRISTPGQLTNGVGGGAAAYGRRREAGRF